MLYQKDNTGTPRVVRYGSKGLSKWQRSYGPTTLELLAMVTSVLDCASYIRGRHFVLECDHQALKPLFQKQLKGAIYERWLAILQQFDLDIEYKPAAQMCVPGALSRNPNFPTYMESSPEEDDPYFPYVSEKPCAIRLPNGEDLANLIPTRDNDCHTERCNEVNFMKTVISPVNYYADTEDNLPDYDTLTDQLSELTC